MPFLFTGIIFSGLREIKIVDGVTFNRRK